MPGFDTEELMGCIKELVSIDKEWIDAVEELDKIRNEKQNEKG